MTSSMKLLTSCTKVKLARMLAISRSNSTSISVSPKKALVDEKLHIQICGLLAKEPVTVHSYQNDEDKKFGAVAHYIADVDGSVDLNNSASIGGNYEGIEPMGLFWSMTQKPGQKNHLRMSKKDVTKPILCSLQLFKGHISNDDIYNATVSSIAETLVSRTYLADTVERIPISHGRVRGTLFLPKGTGPVPGVIDMYGSTGGLLEQRAAILSSKGLAVLSLAYFNYDDLPKEMKKLEVDYFEEAVNFLLDHPRIVSHGVGMMGSSLGGVLQVLIAHCIPKVKAVVSLSGGYGVSKLQEEDGKKWIITDFDHPEFLNNIRWYEKDGDLIVETRFKFMSDWKTFANIQPGKCASSFLFIHGKGDENVSYENSEELVRDLQQNGKTDVEYFFADDAGHLLEPPYQRLCNIQWHSVYGVYVAVGGLSAQHMRAEEQFWKLTPTFFHKHLSCTGISNKL